MSRNEEGVFARWSRRKRARGDDPAAKAETPAAAPPAGAEMPAPDEAMSEEEVLRKLGLPDPDSLQPGDDFRAFMAEHVPAALRRRALRRLWASNPVLANVDGLVEYGEDFTDAATVPEVLHTAWQVGRGFLRDAADEKVPESAETAAEPVADAAEPAGINADEEKEENVCETAESVPEPDDVAAADAPQAPRPRRMTFRTA